MYPNRSSGYCLSTGLPTIQVHEIPFGEGRTLIRNEPIELNVIKSECGDYQTIEFEDLNLCLSEESIEDLKDAFEAVLALIWETYGNGRSN